MLGAGLILTMATKLKVSPGARRVFRNLSLGGTIHHQPEVAKRGQWDPEYYDQNYEGIAPKLIRSMVSKGWVQVEQGEVKLTATGRERWGQITGKQYGKH